MNTVDEQTETSRQAIARERREEAQREGICERCLGNSGIRIKVKPDDFCPSCGCAAKPKVNKI